MHTHNSLQTVVPAPAKIRTRKMRFTLLAAIGALLTVGFSSFSSTPSAYAHDELVGHSLLPATSADSELSPAGFMLNFNNELTQLGAEVIATDPSGNSITDGQPELAGRDLTQRFTAGLAAGQYPISWTVVSSDGHRIAGALTFTVSDTDPATLEIGELETQSSASSSNSTNADADADASIDNQVDTTNNGAPAGLTIAAIAGGIAVFGVVIALFVRKMRQTDQGEPHAGSTA